MIEAAYKYNRIVQHGVQLRSSVAIREAVQHLEEGLIGRVYMSRGLVYRWRPDIGDKGISQTPPALNYDLWCGPAPMRPFTVTLFIITGTGTGTMEMVTLATREFMRLIFACGDWVLILFPSILLPWGENSCGTTAKRSLKFRHLSIIIPKKRRSSSLKSATGAQTLKMVPV